MNARPDVHPTDQVLQGFALGKLADTEIGAVLEHLDGCPDCRRRVAELPDDSFLAKVRAARSTSGTPAPADSALRAARLAAGTMVQRDTPPLPAASVPPGLADLSGYEFLKKLGEGGMGVVYLARNTAMDRLEVLKVMNQTLVGRPEAVERFRQEIRSAARLLHPNVATAFTVHSLGNLLILAMEYVEGDDLAKAVRSRGALPIPFACYCVHQAALGLQRGHELGLVHRDIKPGNILLSRQGKQPIVKIVDFGLAKARTEAPTDRDLTGTNQMMGTPGYSAPEQLNDAKTADTRSDIYSLGCTLYYLLAGESPFKGNSALAIALAQEASAVQPLRDLRPEVPERLAAVVAKMMERDPGRRFNEPKEVAAALVPFIKPPKASSEKTAGPEPAGNDLGQVTAGYLPEHGAVSQPAQANPWSVIAEPRMVPSVARVEWKPSLAEQWSFGGSKRWWLVTLVGMATLFGVAVLGVFTLRVKTPNGTVVLENVPSGCDVHVDGNDVTVSRNGDTLTVTALSEGSHRLKVTLGGREIWSRDVTVKLGGEPVRLTVESTRSADKPRPAEPPAPPATVARPLPLDCTGPNGVPAEDARRAQQTWAGYLGRKVEEEVEIADGVKVTFVLVPPGKFYMGSPDGERDRVAEDETLHTVVLTEPFGLSKYEVTQLQYRALVSRAKSEVLKEADPSEFRGADLPVEQVSWTEADAFGRELTKLRADKCLYRLPTEAEWEYSCRGGRGSSLPLGIGDGHSLSPREINFNVEHVPMGPAVGNNLGRTCKVDSYSPNAFGLYNMHGNVWEWCSDRYGPYPDKEVTNPTGPTEGTDRATRGGGWYTIGEFCRAAYRRKQETGFKNNGLGFRLARSIPSDKLVPNPSKSTDASGGAQAPAPDTTKATAEKSVKELPATIPMDAFQAKSIWVNTYREMTLTVIERKGDRFVARFEFGRKIVREVIGTVKDGKVSWLAKDVHAIGGGVGGDNFGTISRDAVGDMIDFVWQDRPGKSGTYTLRRKASE